jgi:hypothetical protein
LGRRITTSFYGLLSSLLIIVVTDATPDPFHLATVPPMGWNSLYAHYLDVSETVMKDAAEQLIQLGLRDVGYRHVNVDDCWMAPQRDAVTQQLQANPTTFPSGIAELANYLHERNFSLGIYSSAGTMTCTKFPGSIHYEMLDAQTFANWGVDYVKYDNCYSDGTPDIVRHSKMRDAILATNRPMFFSVCNGGGNEIWRWASSVGHAWRSTVDIQRNWNSIYHNYWNNQRQVESILFTKFTNSWLDPDMLQMGSAEGPELPITEQRTQFGLWVLAKAPLILSTNLAKMSNASLAIVSNTRLINLHQNPHYPPAVCYVGCRHITTTSADKDSTASVTWPLPYSLLATSNVLDETRTSEVTVAIIVNWSDENQTLTNLTMYAHDIGIVPMPNAKVVVTDLWTGTTVMETVVRSTLSNDTSKRRDSRSSSNELPVPIVVPILERHDNVIYQFEVVNNNRDCNTEQLSGCPEGIEQVNATL